MVPGPLSLYWDPTFWRQASRSLHLCGFHTNQPTIWPFDLDQTEFQDIAWANFTVCSTPYSVAPNDTLRLDINSQNCWWEHMGTWKLEIPLGFMEFQGSSWCHPIPFKFKQASHGWKTISKTNSQQSASPQVLPSLRACSSCVAYLHYSITSNLVWTPYVSC